MTARRTSHPLSLVLLPMLVLAVGTVGPGCNFAPTLDPVPLPVPNAWPETYELEDGEQTLGELKWDAFFGAPQLRSLIQQALENNRDLREAALNIDAARARYGIQRSAWFPSVTGSAHAGVQRIPGTQIGGDGTVSATYEASVGLTAYELDLFGRVKNLNDAALQEFFATQETRRAVRVSLVAEVATAWMTLLADAERLALVLKALEARRKSLDVIQKRQATGVANSLDVGQARSLVERSEADLLALRRQIALDRNGLTLLVGSPIDEAQLSVPFDQADALRADLPPGLPSTLLVNRPDIRAAEHRLRSSNANIGAARAAFFPRISLTASAGTAATSLTDLFTPASFAWSFIPQVTVPIFQAENFANLELAEVRKNLAIVQYERAIQVAFREVADALVSRATLAEQLTVQRTLLDTLRNNQTLSQQRYDTGIDDYLAVLDAQRSVYEAEQATVALELAMLANQVTLYRALGGGELPQKQDEAAERAGETPRQ